jgi:hypothetical protein
MNGQNLPFSGSCGIASTFIQGRTSVRPLTYHR